MKNLIWLLLLAVAAPACQQKAPVAQAATAPPPPAETPAAAAAEAAQAALPSLFTASDTLTAPMRRLVAEHDLANLWQGDTKDKQGTPAFEGFFGPDHYRFALVFNEVQRDERNPAIYHVRGKCHYRKNVRKFTGTLTIR